MKFKVGEKVGYLNQKGSAIISKILNDNEVIIIDSDGFECKYSVNLLIKLHDMFNLNNLKIISKDSNVYKVSNFSLKHEKRLNKEYIELDLHIDCILKEYKHLTSFEIINIQMRKMKETLQNAKNKNIKKVIVIHGIGEGVLKNEIRSYLHKFPEKFQYFDASYLDYGKGATEVLIY